MSKRPQATTDHAVKSAKPEAKAYKMGAGNGMYLFVSPTGVKYWRLKYRIDGKENTFSIGTYPEVSLAQARLKREEARSLIAEGIHPQEQQDRERQKAKADALTFKDIAERWYKGKTELSKKPWAVSTATKIRHHLDKDIYPAIGDKPVREITRLDLIDLNERIEKRGAFEPAAKIRRWLGVIFDEAFDRGEVEQNVAHRLKPSFYSSGAVSKHHPFIRFNELPDLIEAVGAATNHQLIKIAINLLILTAVRPSELRFAEWPEFDLIEGVWNIPAERMKMRRPHTVPLPNQAIELLQQVKAINPEGFLFIVQGDKPYSENTVNKVLKDVGYHGRQTGHGFRHLLSTELNERGYNRDWIEKQLAHGSKDKIRDTYNKAEYLDQRRQMMQEWANSIDALREGANVVAFKHKAKGS